MNTYNPLEYQRNNLLQQQQLIQNQLNQINQLSAQRQTTQFNPYPQQQSDPFYVKSVGSIEEAKGWPVDPGKIYLFPDTGTGDIYLKRLNTDNGKSEIIPYKPIAEQEVVQKTTVSEEKTIVDRLDMIEKRIGEIYESISNIAKTRSADFESNRSYATGNASKNAATGSSKVQSSKTDAERKE